jgi:hypothetical protein
MTLRHIAFWAFMFLVLRVLFWFEWYVFTTPPGGSFRIKWLPWPLMLLCMVLLPTITQTN